jgi:hypothetical protein
MLQQVRALVANNPGLKAKEIARRLGFDRHELNSLLHHNREIFDQDDDFTWTVISQHLTITFDQSNWIDSGCFEKSLARVESALESSCKKVVFVISQGCNLLLDSIARLIALSNQLVMYGKEVVIDFRQRGTYTYVNRIGFFEHLDHQVIVLPTRPDSSGAKRFLRNSNRLVELGIIDPDNLDESLAIRLKEVFVSHAGAQYNQAAFTFISELLGNVRDHSESPIPGFIGLQFYENFSPPHIQTVISDSGKGILGTLGPVLKTKYPELAKLAQESNLDPDIYLLQQVFTKGQITQSNDEARGLGLKSSKDAASKYNATILVRQNTCEVKFYFRQGKKPKFDYKVNLPLLRGTHICFDFVLDTNQ